MMQRIDRRTALLGGLFAGSAALLGPLALRGIDVELQRIVRANFGAHVAATEDAALFVGETAELWRGLNSRRNQFWRPKYWALAAWHPGAARERQSLELRVVELFLRATNYVRHEETGEDLFYIGIPDPYQVPCANPLSAQWL